MAVRLATEEDTPPRQALPGEFLRQGTTRLLSIHMTAVGDRKRVKVSGRFTIIPSDFGIRPDRKGLGTAGVADRLTIHGEQWLTTSADGVGY